MRIQVDGFSIHYDDSGGPGEPVVFVHGFPLSSRMWSSQIRALAPRRTVTVDLLGFGHSDAPDDLSAYSMDGYARQVEAVIHHLDRAAVVLCGLSMGGYVSLALLRSASELVSALVLADTRAEPDTRATMEKRTGQQSEVRANGTAKLIDELANNLPSAVTVSERPDIVAGIKALMDSPPAGVVGALEAMKTRPDSTPLLAEIKVPTLVIVGEADSIAPVESAESLSRSIEGSALIVIPGAGHLSNLEKPDVFNEVLLEFLDRL